jgi:sulfatase modifying factor 1
MNRTSLLLFLAASLPQACLAAVTFDWAYVGNAGNAADPETGFGAVAYNFAVSTTEVTNAQYTEFLNAVAATNENGLYNANMGTHLGGGISRAGTWGDFTYSVRPNMAHKPVNFLSYISAMRFVNWLHNGQGNGGTETGAYSISDGLHEKRALGARYWIPSENEWYKAAFHQPAELDGDIDDYWRYPTSTNTIPTVASANSVGEIENPGPNVANYGSGADWNLLNGNVTTVGSAGPLSANYYGLLDVAGNVWEFNEARISSVFRGMRGGSLNNTASNLEAEARGQIIPTAGAHSIGFRIATIPEPTTLALAAMLAGCGLLRHRSNN